MHGIAVFLVVSTHFNNNVTIVVEVCVISKIVFVSIFGMVRESRELFSVNKINGVV